VKIYHVTQTKFNQDHQPADKAYLNDIRLTNISKSFTHKMAAETSWHRYGTKLRHCHPMYRHNSVSVTVTRWWQLTAENRRYLLRRRYDWSWKIGTTRSHALNGLWPRLSDCLGLLFTARCYASAVLAMALCLSVCPSVCLSVCLSRAGVLLKRQNLGSHNNTTRYPRDSCFLKSKISAKFDRGHPLRGRQMQVG